MIVEIARPESKPADSTSKLHHYISICQGGRNEGEERTVVLCPPGEVAAADDVVEDKADNAPGDVVRGRRGWDETRAAENDREIDVSERWT